MHAQSWVTLQPRGLYPTRLLCLWDFPGNDTGEGGLPFPPSGDLPELGIKPESPASPSLAGGFFTTKPPGKSHKDLMLHTITLGARVSAYEFGKTQICHP